MYRWGIAYATLLIYNIQLLRTVFTVLFFLVFIFLLLSVIFFVSFFLKKFRDEFSYFFTKKLAKISQSSKNLAYYTCKKNIYRR